MVKERMPNGAPPGRPPARGVVFVHSCPRALCTHVEWAVAGVLRHALPTVTWTPQQVAPGSVRTEFPWTGEPGTASRLASTLRGWPHLRVEITEEPTPGCEGERYALTPSLGIFRAVVGVNGDIQVPEERLRAALVRAELAAATGEREDGDPDASLADEIHRLLGRPWDDELEPFRIAGEDTPVRWLHRVGWG